MIKLPDPAAAFQHEQDFLLSCGPSRIGKMLALYDIYQRTRRVPGAIVECGVFRGGSFTMWAMLRHLLESEHTRSLIGFDTFGEFPRTPAAPDQRIVDHIQQVAGLDCIGADQLVETLSRRGRGLEANTTLVPGDVCETVPKYVADHPELAISLLMIDTDLYEPAVTCLTELVPLVSPGGIVIVDNYGVFPGETQAFREYLAAHPDTRLEQPAHTGHLMHFSPSVAAALPNQLAPAVQSASDSEVRPSRVGR
ncbi:TylF/MycF/NovP-related O-methyltransferase [Streptomyces sp. Li-HN-5-11]|uniref:TylF/MycF/NovP-related O-methyltransferase n=1 Tax=Streptomyces sp. Li-HN-5-11 TaxID=3075432 RepID=UPI0028ADD86E|nr:TylF/MycF/NovP-related O-methyltransferase [Streptomyces sp. Li-HN-5-11]WNM29230.1 TylF/MycF/NovP-related O-methyltransferase [Streptomyces sp. Li-HN-5-11]